MRIYPEDENVNEKILRRLIAIESDIEDTKKDIKKLNENCEKIKSNTQLKSNTQIYSDCFLTGLSALLGSIISKYWNTIADFLSFEDSSNSFIAYIISTIFIIILFFICIGVLKKILCIIPYRIFDAICNFIFLIFLVIFPLISLICLFLKEYKESIVLFVLFIIYAIFVYKYIWKNIYNPNKKKNKK